MTTERIDAMIELAQSEIGLIVGTIEQNRRMFGTLWERELEELLTLLFDHEEALRDALNGYAEFIVDSMRLQLRFQEDKDYIPQSYDDVAAEVYQNEQYMMRLYLPGILVSHYFWVHHYRQLVFFKNSFLRDMQHAENACFHDVGVGTGFYSNMILKNVPHARGCAWDLSPYAIQHAKTMIARFGHADRFETRQEDILTTEGIGQRPFLVCVEVLEHLEDPQAFLVGLHRMVKPGGKAFITAAINAPNKDHIYLYRNEMEVLEQLLDAGFHIEQFIGAYAYEPRKNLAVVPSLGAYVVLA